MIGDRIYWCEGETVYCYELIDYDENDYKCEFYKISDTPVFTVKCGSTSSAVILLEDLYYGEYTGG